jgi:hypothetical protein
LTNQKQQLPLAAMFVNRSGQNEQSLYRTFHICFIPSCGSFDQTVSEKKISRNRQTRNKNCLWRPFLLMDCDEMSKIYRDLPQIYASYHASVPLAKRFQRRRFLQIDQPETKFAYGGHVFNGSERNGQSL